MFINQFYDAEKILVKILFIDVSNLKIIKMFKIIQILD